MLARAELKPRDLGMREVREKRTHTHQNDLGRVRLFASLDPNWFCQNILRSPNDPWQAEVIDAVADVYRKQMLVPTVINHFGHNKISVRSGHSPGKTHMAAKLMHWFNFCFHGRIPCTAPKEKQLLTRLWPEFYRIYMKAVGEYRASISYKSSKIIWNNDPTWYAVAETASQPENLAGHHDEYMMVIVDEASGVPEEMYPVIESMQASGKLVILLLIGNPTRTAGTFWASHCKREVSEQYFPYHVTLDKAPRVSRKWVLDQERKYGRNSPVVKVRCYGEFASTESDQLIALEWLEMARGKSLPDPGARGRLRISIDVADGGLCETVFTVSRLYEKCTVLLRQFARSYEAAHSPIEAGKEAMRLWAEWRGEAHFGDDIVVDSMGTGAGTAGYLMEHGYPVITYRGGESSDDPKEWRNRRVQSYLVMRNGLRDGWLYIDEQFTPNEMEWGEFVAQMCALKRRPGTERLEDIETKQDLIRRGVKSPDRADSAAMTCAGQQPILSSKPSSQLLAAAPMMISQRLESAYFDTSLTDFEPGTSAADFEW